MPGLRPPARPELVDSLHLDQVARVGLQPVQRLLRLTPLEDALEESEVPAGSEQRQVEAQLVGMGEQLGTDRGDGGAQHPELVPLR